MADPYAGGFRRGEEILAPMGYRREQQPERPSRALVHILTGVVIVSTFLLIFASVFWNIHSPKLTIDYTRIKNYSPMLPDSLNLTLVSYLTIENHNYGVFKYDICKAKFMYRNFTIGKGEIAGGGEVMMWHERVMKITAEVRLEKLYFSHSWSSIDGFPAVMELHVNVIMSGKINVKHVVMNTRTTVHVMLDCPMILDLTTESITMLECIYRVHELVN